MILKTFYVLFIHILTVNVIKCKRFVSSDNCSESEYFNTNQLSCVSCVLQPYGYDWIHESKLQIRTSDGFSCVCRSGYHMDFSTADERKPFYCKNDTIDCPKGAKPMNGFQCAYCSPNMTKREITDSCVCLEGYHLVHSLNRDNESAVDLRCEKCHKHLTSDGQTCKPCHNSYIKVSDQCVCPNTTHTEEDGMCLPLMRSIHVITMDDLDHMSSFYIEDTNRKFISDHFYRRSRPAVYNCDLGYNQSACQLVANLCVLYHYSYSDDTRDESNICKVMLKLKKSDIYYKRESNTLGMSEPPNQFKVNDRLEFIASRFAINGQLIGYSDLNIKEIQLCYENEKSSKTGLVFNANFRQTCVRTTRDLWDNYEPKNTFFELYLKNDTNNGFFLYPIPVVVRNLKRNGKLVNNEYQEYDTNERHNSAILTRRFFLIESITGVEKSSDDPKHDYHKTRPKFIRIAKSLSIDVRLRRQDGTGSIYPPLVTILYENLYLNDYKMNTEIEIDFSITYSMDYSDSKENLSIVISVLCCAAVLWSIFRTWCWAKRNGKTVIDFFTTVEFIVNAMAMISLVFFGVNIVFAINIFLMFKNQSVIHTVLSNPSQEISLIVYIIIAFILKIIHLSYKLIVISTADVFFIDWERPKRREITSLVSITSPKSGSPFIENESDDKFSSERQIKSNTGSRLSAIGSPTSPPLNPVTDKPAMEFPNVTVWRTNFVANEWMELCGHRRLSFTIHIILVILCLDWFGFANLSASEPKNSFASDESQRYVPQSTTCRLAIGALAYSVLALLNITFNRFIYENLFNNKLHQFVDLCSVCNISLFALVYKRFGYYIHGLSPNGKSDVNMLEMYEHLEREKNDLCSKRGLLPNSDHQTFEMSVPSAITEHYQRVRSNLSDFGKISAKMRSFGTQLSKADTEKLIPTYLMINKFLIGFIEHNFKDVDYMVREKTTVESILDVEFNDIRDKGFFYTDNGHSFEAILFYGLEFTLLCFEMMLFLVTDLCFESFTFSAAVTYVVSMIIRKLYLNICRKNLVRKALLDQRFLI